MERNPQDFTSAPVISHEEVHTTAPTVSHSVVVDPSDKYRVEYNKRDNNVNLDQTAAPVVVQGSRQSEKPKDFVNTSCFVILACNFIFGLLGRHYGLKSNYAWQLGDMDTAKKQSKRALIFNVVGIICGVLTYTLALVLYLTLFRSTAPPLKPGTFG